MDTVVPYPASPGGAFEDARPTVPASGYATPWEVLEDTALERAEKREILAFWASDACAVESRPWLRQPPGAPRPVTYADIMRALRILDGLEPDGPPAGGAAAWPPGRRRAIAGWTGAGAEPTLEEALADPIVRLVMARDGVRDADLRRVIDRVGGGRTRARAGGRG